jgi:hypothetical protein
MDHDDGKRMLVFFLQAPGHRGKPWISPGFRTVDDAFSRGLDSCKARRRRLSANDARPADAMSRSGAATATGGSSSSSGSGLAIAAVGD